MNDRFAAWFIALLSFTALIVVVFQKDPAPAPASAPPEKGELVFQEPSMYTLSIPHDDGFRTVVFCNIDAQVSSESVVINTKWNVRTCPHGSVRMFQEPIANQFKK